MPEYVFPEKIGQLFAGECTDTTNKPLPKIKRESIMQNIIKIPIHLLDERGITFGEEGHCPLLVLRKKCRSDVIEPVGIGCVEMGNPP